MQLEKCRRVETRAALQAKGREIDVQELMLSPSARPLGEGSFGTVYQVRGFEHGGFADLSTSSCAALTIA